MHVRHATAADAESIAQVHVSSWKDAYRGIMPDSVLDGLSVETRRATWDACLIQGDPQVLIAEDAGQIIGFCSFGDCRDADRRPGDFEVWSIYLASSHWSKGGGRALWLAARDELIIRGAKCIRLWVLTENHRAIRFYLSMGFRVEEERTNVLTFDGVNLIEARYHLRVAD